jgi:hypothetical protein
MRRKRTYLWNLYLSFLQLLILASCTPHNPSYLFLWRYGLSLVVGQKPLHLIFSEKYHLQACSFRWLSFLGSSCHLDSSELLQKWLNANPENSVDYSGHQPLLLNDYLYLMQVDSFNLYRCEVQYDSYLTLSLLLKLDDTDIFFQEWM